MEEIDTKILNLEKHLALLKNIRIRMLNKKQETCSHNFIREDNGDMHRGGYYYTCSHCGFFTNQKPAVRFT